MVEEDEYWFDSPLSPDFHLHPIHEHVLEIFVDLRIRCLDDLIDKIVSLLLLLVPAAGQLALILFQYAF